MVEQTIQRHGGLGIASFVIALVALLLIVMLFLLAGALKVSGAASPAVNMAVGFGIFGLWFVDLVAIGLGIAGAMEKTSKKVFPVLGLVIGIATLVVSVGVVLIGIRMSGGG